MTPASESGAAQTRSLRTIARRPTRFRRADNPFGRLSYASTIHRSPTNCARYLREIRKSRIYDLVRNVGHLNIGLSHDTSAFACDSFRWYWRRIGQQCYPDATSILWLCDCGGSNAASQYLFKQDLQTLVNDLGIEIRVAHYPSYCSKFNPIERRFFPHVARACQGMLFDSVDTVVRLMRKASTSTGLRTTVNVIRRVYQIGRHVGEDFKSTMSILFDDLLPKWNYVARPC